MEVTNGDFHSNTARFLCHGEYIKLDFVLDRRKHQPVHTSLVIGNETVEKVQSFKYLSMVQDNKLSCQESKEAPVLA